MLSSIFVPSTVILLSLFACEDSVDNPAEEIVEVTAKPEPKEPNPTEVILTKETTNEAFNYAKIAMDETMNQSSMGTQLFAFWANVKMKWSDVDISKDETSFGMVKKDIDPERGKRMCWSGSIVQIQKTPDMGFNGILMTKKGNVIHYYAAGSTGELVEKSSARFCGFVTGLFSYGNTGGGVTHGIDMVGMFKLPANSGN
jgi:hypothetical protein